MNAYVIGVDYGSLSARALLVNAKNGDEIAKSVYEYPNAVMDMGFEDWALQNPKDYEEALEFVITDVLRKSNVDSKDIVGVGVDFTACTVLPIKNDGTPLCYLDEYKDEKHAYVKMWKHHAGQNDAEKMDKIAKDRDENFIKRYGNKISSEWLLPKMAQLVRENKKVYDAADLFIEAGDWIVMKLTGNITRNSCASGYKAFWSKKEGYPSNDYLKEIDPNLDRFYEKKLKGQVLPIGSKAGEITKEASKRLGLKEGTSVAVANVDAHVAFPSAGIYSPNCMLMIIGTSTCHMLVDKEERNVSGICGVVEDGILPGYFGYEAGQSCVGDHFEWFINNAVPKEYFEEAEKRDINIFRLLNEKAEKYKVGESGLIALDWWNGNRSILVDADLTGVILGLTLKTKPEEIYRALVEATAYGTQTIIENFEEHAISIDKIYAAGGISQKDEMFMQIYSDVIGKEIGIVDSAQAPAYGAAIFGSVAAGIYNDVNEAAKKLGKIKKQVYKPNIDNNKVYKKLYKEYKILHNYFGKGENNVMKRLKNIKKNISNKEETENA